MNNIRRRGWTDTPSDHISIVISMGNEKRTAPPKPRATWSVGLDSFSIARLLQTARGRAVLVLLQIASVEHGGVARFRRCGMCVLIHDRVIVLAGRSPHRSADRFGGP